MPTYEYECVACQHAFEALQGMAEPEFKKCPKCGKQKLVRLIGSGSGMIFKGSGFYETDYKKKTSTEPPAKSGSASGGKTDKPVAPALAPASSSCGGACACHPHS